MSAIDYKLINYGNLTEFHNQLLNDSSVSDKATWSSNKITTMIAGAGFNTAFVNELPASGDIHTIYFVPSSSALAGNVYDEFMWNASASEWEQVGSTAIDLTDIINDASILSNRTWSSSKIYSEISGIDSSLALKADVSYVDSSLALKQDVLTAGTGIDISNGVISATGGGGSVDLMQSITYAELKALRDNKQLVPGQQYRITDYVTTTAQANTQSAGHQFDIIVVADSEDRLNENARAIQHSGDTYFANSKLESWELKYCLDNDTNRFSWAQVGEEGYNIIQVNKTSNVQPLKLVIGDYYDCYGDNTEGEGKYFIDTNNYEFIYNGTVSDGNTTYYKWHNSEKNLDVLTSEMTYKNAPSGINENGCTYYSNIFNILGTIIVDGETFDEFYKSYKRIISTNNTNNYIYKRYEDGDENNQYAWVLVNNTEDVYIGDYNIDLDDIDTSDILYTDSENPTVGTVVSGVTIMNIEQVAGVPVGCGVIYYLKDEFNNECPYDFKNIQFKRNLLAVDNQNYMQLINLAGWYGPDYNDDAQFIPICNTAYNALSQVNAHSFFYTLGTSNVQELGNSEYESLDEYLKAEESMSDGDLYIILSINEDYGPQLIAKATSTERYLYTFTSESGIANNHSIIQSSIIDNSLSITSRVNNNKFEETIENNKIQLLDNVLFGNGCSNTFGNGCYSNTFGNGCNFNTFGNGCNSNTFGNYCSNTFGNSCYSNMFGNGCYYNTFGNGCYYNTFGNDCNDNTFGNGCNYNTFGNDCYYNTFGNDCCSNTFGNDCYSNMFGNSCYYNTFGNDGNDNTFGNGCYYNTFGNDCYYNTFGNGCNYNNFTTNYNASFSNKLQYINVLNGYSANGDVPSGIALNATYSQTVGLNSQGVFTVKNPLD